MKVYKGGQMIIIKSQDGKSIRNYGSVNLNYQTQTEIIGIPISPIILVNSEEMESNEAHYVLGNYKTEERALEVMEKIEDYINQVAWAKCYGGNSSAVGDVGYISETKMIYTMPKE